MPRYVALLKGVNVGGNKKVSMAELRERLTELGFTEVTTYLQSGNAVLTSPDSPDEVAARIQAGILESFGMKVRCLIRTGPELREVIDGHPLTAVADNGSRMFALFLSEAPAPALLAEHDPTQLAPDEIRVGDRVVYQWCPNGALEAPNASAFIEKNLKVTVTGRNWNTVNKLAELLG